MKPARLPVTLGTRVPDIAHNDDAPIVTVSNIGTIYNDLGSAATVGAATVNGKGNYFTAAGTGRFTLTSIPAGTYNLKISATGCLDLYTTIVINNDGSYRILGAVGGAVYMRILISTSWSLNLSGGGTPSGTINCILRDQATGKLYTTTWTGSYLAISNVPDGNYDCTITGSDIYDASFTVSISPAGTFTPSVGIVIFNSGSQE